LFLFFFDDDSVDEGLQDGSHCLYWQFAAEEIFGEDARGFGDLCLGHWWCGLVAGLDQFVVFGEDDSAFAFEIGELIHEGLAAAAVGYGIGCVGNLGGELFLFILEDGEAFFAFGFMMIRVLLVIFLPLFEQGERELKVTFGETIGGVEQSTLNRG